MAPQIVNKVIFIQRKVLGNEGFPKWNPYCHDFCLEKAKAALPPHCLVRSIDGIHFRRGKQLGHDFRRRKWLCHHAMVKAFCYAKRSATAPFSSGCILVRSVFAILRVSSLTNKKIATMVMTFAKQKWLCHRTVLCGQ